MISRNVALRNELDLYVNVLTCKSYDGIVARQKNIDISIVRQNTEGEYAMLEHEVFCSSNASIFNWFLTREFLKSGREKFDYIYVTKKMPKIAIVGLCTGSQIALAIFRPPFSVIFDI